MNKKHLLSIVVSVFIEIELFVGNLKIKKYYNWKILDYA
jgi:hypothetical protein